MFLKLNRWLSTRRQNREWSEKIRSEMKRLGIES